MKRILVALSFIALSTSALADNNTPTPFSQLRQEEPTVDAAIANLPTSDLNGTFNRLSALQNRAPISTLADGAGDAGTLPANFIRNFDATLRGLAEDLAALDVAAMSTQDRDTILQLVRLYAFKRVVLDFYPATQWSNCDPCTPGFGSGHTCPTCYGTDNPQLLDALDLVALKCRPLWSEVSGEVVNATGDEPGTRDAERLFGTFFIETIDTAHSLAIGVESIDD